MWQQKVVFVRKTGKLSGFVTKNMNLGANKRDLFIVVHFFFYMFSATWSSLLTITTSNDYIILSTINTWKIELFQNQKKKIIKRNKSIKINKKQLKKQTRKQISYIQKWSIWFRYPFYLISLQIMHRL